MVRRLGQKVGIKALFEAAAENPLGVFAADSIGAALGSMISFFIPIVLGFHWFFAIATLVFWITAVSVFGFFRRGPGLEPTLRPARETPD